MCGAFFAGSMTEKGLPSRSSIGRRLHALRRDRESVRRILEQADLERIREDAGRTEARLDAMEAELAGEAAADDDE